MTISIAFLVGALIITFLLSRLVGVGFRSKSGIDKHVPVHGITLALATLLGGYGMADGGDPEFVGALFRYLPAVLTWLAFDVIRDRREKSGSSTP